MKMILSQSNKNKNKIMTKTNTMDRSTKKKVMNMWS